MKQKTISYIKFVGEQSEIFTTNLRQLAIEEWDNFIAEVEKNYQEGNQNKFEEDDQLTLLDHF